MNPAVVAVIQARMSSSRLPGKVLRSIGDITVLEQICLRLRRAQSVDKIVVATSVDPSDDAIVAAAAEFGVDVVRGSLDDVLGRHVHAAMTVGAEHIVRIPGDKPFVDPGIVDEVVRLHRSSGADYTANIHPDHPATRWCPLGFEVEVARMQALRVADAEARESHQREHVTPFLYENPSRFLVVRLPMSANVVAQSQFRLTLDTPDDLALIQAVAELLADPVKASIDDILEQLARHPSLAALNSHVAQRSQLNVGGVEPTS